MGVRRRAGCAGCLEEMSSSIIPLQWNVLTFDSSCFSSSSSGTWCEHS